MKKQISYKKIPVGVLLIAAFYIFGALVLLVSVFTNPADASLVIASVHGLPGAAGVWILAAVAILALVLAYGLIRLSRWGYILAVVYLLYFAGTNLVMGGFNFLRNGQAEDQVFFGNLLWSVLVMVYLFLVRRRFSGKQYRENRG